MWSTTLIVTLVCGIVGIFIWIGLFWLYKWHRNYARQQEQNFDSFYQRPVVKLLMNYIYCGLLILVAAANIIAWAIFFTSLAS